MSRGDGIWGVLGVLGLGLSGCTNSVFVFGETEAETTGFFASTVAVGDRHACAISMGRLFCWGDNTFGQLGRPSEATAVPYPRQVGTSDDYVSVAAGSAHTCGVRSAAEMLRLECWGSNANGQAAQRAEQIDTPALVRPPMDLAFERVFAGKNQTCALTDDGGAGQMACWGLNEHGQVGIGDMIQEVIDATSLEGPDGMLDGGWFTVALGERHGCGLFRAPGDERARLACWGNNEDYALGIENTATFYAPRTVIEAGVSSPDWAQVGVGRNHSCARTHAQQIYCWGQPDFAQLGSEEGAPYRTPFMIDDGGDEPTLWIDLYIGDFATCGIYNAGRPTLACAGQNASGRFGTFDTERGMIDILSDLYEPDTSFKSPLVDIGPDNLCVLKGGQVLCAGSNAHGQLGQGDVLPHMGWVPVRAPEISP